MKQPLDATVTTDLGREICLRDGGIRALLTGRVEKLGSTYILSTNVVEPARGLTVASLNEEAANQEQVLPAVRRLSNRVRETLGEALSGIQQTDQDLAKVTTPSLRALQLYTQADAALVARGDGPVAEELLRLAVSEDPDFASGFLHLAWAIRKQRRPKEEYLPHAERALQLSERTSERERYFIRGSYYQMIGQEDNAAAAFEALVRLYPDHFWGLHNLAYDYAYYLGRPLESIPHFVRRAEIFPNHFVTNVEAAVALAIWQAEPTRAKPYLQRARELLSPEVRKEFPWYTTWFDLFPVYEHWLQGDLDQAMRAIKHVEKTFEPGSESEVTPFAMRIGCAYLTLGRLREAEEWLRRPELNHYLALVAFAREDFRALHHHMTKPGRSMWTEQFVTILLARTGHLSEAEKHWSAYMKHVTGDAFMSSWTSPIPVVRAELALAKGETREAIPILEQGVHSIRNTGYPVFYLGSESLARLLEEEGELDKALQVLEAASAERTLALDSDVSPFFWLRIQLQLAEVYRKLDREQEAQEIEGELKELLKYADPDHAILRQLRQSSTDSEQTL
jgi:tetratricopeptide (TPR) repeat protein